MDEIRELGMIMLELAQDQRELEVLQRKLLEISERIDVRSIRIEEIKRKVYHG